jgi:putative tryptophan/tyrosine transport system substrate-binding protein
MVEGIINLVRYLVWGGCALLLASLPSASDSRGNAPQRIIFFTAIGSPLLDASFQQFREAFTTRHPELTRQTRIDALPVASDPGALAQDVRTAALTKPILFVAHTGQHAQVARAVAPHVPLVFSSYTDPRELGVASSLGRHPEATTGLWMNDELNGKRLELLLDAYAQVRVVAALGDVDWYHGIGQERGEMRTVAASRGVELRLVQASSVEEALAVVDSPAMAGVQAWCLPRTSLSLDGRLVRHLSQTGRPVVVAYAQDLYEGAHLSYTYDRTHHPKVLADLAARILQGESPGAIPIQTPGHFQLAVRIDIDPRLPPLNPDVVRRADLIIR